MPRRVNDGMNNHAIRLDVIIDGVGKLRNQGSAISTSDLGVKFWTLSNLA